LVNFINGRGPSDFNTGKGTQIKKITQAYLTPA
jgi:hypothetical protein